MFVVDSLPYISAASAGRNAGLVSMLLRVSHVPPGEAAGYQTGFPFLQTSGSLRSHSYRGEALFERTGDL